MQHGGAEENTDTHRDEFIIEPEPGEPTPESFVRPEPSEPEPVDARTEVLVDNVVATLAEPAPDVTEAEIELFEDQYLEEAT